MTAGSASSNTRPRRMVPRPRPASPASASLPDMGRTHSLPSVPVVSGRAPVWDPSMDEIATTMRAAIFTGPKARLELGTVARPEPRTGELLVKVTACGLCHSDLHYMDHGVPTFRSPPLVLGHEISG